MRVRRHGIVGVIAGMMLGAACGADAQPGHGWSIEVSARALSETEHFTGADLRFDDFFVHSVVVAPSPLVPGQPASLTFTVNGESHGMRAVIDVSPPRSASRQVAVGGLDAPPVHVDPDPRAAGLTANLQAGSQTIEIPPLPIPWHPRRAMITMTARSGGLTLPATVGPRLADGTGILALVPVATAPTQIEAPKSADAIAIDGELDEPVWAGEGTVLVESLDGEPWDGPPTTMWASWDDENLYIAARVVDSDVWSDFTRHDDPLWEQEVFEVFVFADDDDRDYLELQLSPRGVTFDARFSRHRQADRDFTSEFVTAAKVDGTLDDRDDRDVGWTAELAIPWAEICAETSASCPPRAGMSMRINAFRFERPAAGGTVGLALSPTRIPDFHAVANAAMLTLHE